MLKRLVYLLLMSLFINSVYAQKIRTLFYDDILYGKVKQVSESEYSPGISGPEVTDTTWYDEKGNTIENHRRTMHGTFFGEKYIYSNNASGIDIAIISSLKDQNINGKLNNAGNLTEYNSYFKKGGTNFKSTYEYDKQNNLLRFKFFDKGNTLTWMKTYKYDKDDLPIEQYYWKQDGTLDYSINFKYLNFDKAGNWTKRTSQKTSASGKISEGPMIARQISYY
jgi:hypothetical protein